MLPILCDFCRLLTGFENLEKVPEECKNRSFPYSPCAKLSQSILLQQKLVRTLSHASSPCSVHNVMACVRNACKLPTQRKQLFPLGRLSRHYSCAVHVHTSSDKLNRIHSTQQCYHSREFRANAAQTTWPIGRSTCRILSVVDDSTV